MTFVLGIKQYLTSLVTETFMLKIIRMLSNYDLILFAFASEGAGLSCGWHQQ